MRLRRSSVWSLSRSTRPARSSARSNSDGPPCCGSRPRTASAVSRLSSVQSSTNCTNACRSSCCAGMPSTICGARVGGVAHGAGMADRAVEPDLIDAEAAAPRHADRQVLAGLA